MTGLSITAKVLIGTSLLGCVAGMAGSFVVLRRRALVGDMLAHAALPGLCIAYLVIGDRHRLGLLLGAFLAGLLAMGVLTLVTRTTRTKEDAAIGIVLSTFYAAGIVLLSVIAHVPQGNKAGLSTYLFGQASSMLDADIAILSVVSLVALVVLMALYKELKVFSFDPEFARSQGWPTLMLDMTMMGTLTVVTIVGLPIVGVVLMAALIIIPGAAARFWTERLGVMLVLSAVIGAATGSLGTLESSGQLAQWLGFDPLGLVTGGIAMPTGPVIVLCGAAIFLFSVLFAPRRGVISRAVSEVNLRRKTARENLLRTLYELSEHNLEQRPPIALEAIRARRAWSPWAARWLLAAASRRGDVERKQNQVRLTPKGLRRAAEVTRAHRLWEMFLIEGANIASDHVDRDADSIEHLLTPDTLDALEKRLADSGALPEEDRQVPVSPHALEESESTPSRDP